MRRVNLKVQSRSGNCLNLVTTDVSTKALLRLTIPDLDDAEKSSPAASFLRLHREPVNNVLRYCSGEDWINLMLASKAGRLAVGASPWCWRQEEGGKAAYLARRRALFRVSRAFQVGCPAEVRWWCARRCLFM